MKFWSPGKLLISGEYAVLFGAKALAVPTVHGQSMVVNETGEDEGLAWTATDNQGQKWFQSWFNANLEIVETSDRKASQTLQFLLQFCKQTNPKLNLNVSIQTVLDFNRSWGLGSSSTLIANLAKWSGADHYDLLKSCFSGSGYDVEIGMQNTSLLYQLINGRPFAQKTNWKPKFYEDIYFVYLEKKQDSERDIQSAKLQFSNEDLKTISEITDKIHRSESLSELSFLLEEHEALISGITRKEKVKDTLFRDFSGTIKSLGAWGGDFVMVCDDQRNYEYFKQLGYNTILKFEELIQP